MEVKVRVSETDILGHINNTSYFVYMEEARINYLETLGVDFESTVDAFILASVKCDFLQQGYFGQVLNIETFIARIGTKSLTVTNKIYEKDSGELIAEGEATMVYYSIQEQQSMPIPNSLRQQLEEKKGNEVKRNDEL